MPKGYQHLTRDQRCQIYALKTRGVLQKDMAKQLKVSPSTIFREIARNSGRKGYRFQQADRFATERRQQASTQPRVMTPEMIGRVTQHLQEKWSPEQIAGRLAREGISISHELIYQYVWADKRSGGTLYTHLRHHGKKYNKRSSGKAGRGCIPNRVDITARPAIVETKTRIGDWEGDTVVGPQHQSALLTYVDRKSKFTIIARLPKKTAENVVNATVKRFASLKKAARTITYDNGTEFASHAKISQKIGVKCYFATPYHSWERGLNEHTNGQIRQFFPKGTDFNKVTDAEVAAVEKMINNRPRKV